MTFNSLCSSFFFTFFINKGDNRSDTFCFVKCILPLVLLGCENNDLSKGNHLAEDEPDVNHLDVGGGGQALHLADEYGGHHEHRGQVNTQGCLKEERLKEGGGVGDHHEEEGGEVGGHHLTHDLPPHTNHHLNTSLGVCGIDKHTVKD